jgi:hypothetical protein
MVTASSHGPGQHADTDALQKQQVGFSTDENELEYQNSE